ncbi:hypothetical protein LV89_04225 [Arcicella aurantiaca]|uniref:Natural product n=1 Tax=Arcicella aurantiaca TaxID=591202 RepID=A0A316DIS7_9BACT|nr:class I lanthipeptide [Arcicella aurantiaca]PWK18074.1 hypothetical protein LV89_04225 [Arcicella aurantiaca]
MKKQIKVINQLALDKETISKLDEDQLKNVAGGGSLSCNGAAAVAESDDEVLGFNSCCNDSCNKN